MEMKVVLLFFSPLSAAEFDVLIWLDRSDVCCSVIFHHKHNNYPDFCPTVTHHLKFFITATSGLSDFPVVKAVAQVNDQVVGFCDTDSKKLQTKQSFIQTFLEVESDLENLFSYHCTHILPDFYEQFFERMLHFNQTAGPHIVQRMGGCQWDEDTDRIIPLIQYAYDGEDFIALDPDTETWVAPTALAFHIKHTWDLDRKRIIRLKTVFTHDCPMWLKKSLDYGKTVLMRKDFPSLSFHQKSPSSPVTCHATGFYPSGAALFWRRDAEELQEDVDRGETLPNHDGTFQISSELRLSSVPLEEWEKYECVFQLSGVKEGLVTKLDPKKILSNRQKPPVSTIIIVICALLGGVAVVVGIGFLVVRSRKKDKRSPPSVIRYGAAAQRRH